MTVEELENWFATVELPKGETMLFPGTTILNSENFLKVQFASLKKDPNSKANLPVWHRLKAFKLLIEANLE